MPLAVVEDNLDEVFSCGVKFRSGCSRHRNCRRRFSCRFRPGDEGGGFLVVNAGRLHEQEFPLAVDGAFGRFPERLQPELAAGPRHFAYPVAAHETLFGLLPLASRPAQRLLQQVRPWIEPAQSIEKNQLGLGQMFFNNLRLVWQMSLWADSAVLLRTMAWRDVPTETHLLAPLTPRQMELNLSEVK